MKRCLAFSTVAALAALTAATSSFSPARADVEDRLYDFTDTYYRQNGVDPSKIGGRRTADGVLAVADAPIFSFQRNVRALLTLPAYDHSGNPWFFTVLGGGSTTLFTANSAGQKERQLADESPEYVFPRRGSAPFSLGALRQSVLLDMRHGYFSNNRLGIWIHTFVSYTDRALNTPAGRQELQNLARKNGVDLDGTPIIRTQGDIDQLFSKGLITKSVPPADNPLRYAFCPVVKDPTDGGIAHDQFLSITRKPDGTPVEPAFLNTFNRLQATGR